MLSFLTSKMTGKKYVKDAVKDVWHYQVVGQVFNCHKQTPTPEEIEMYDGKIGQMFDVWTTPNCVFDISDRVTIDGEDFKVRGVKELTHGSFPHKKYIVVKED